VDSRESFAVQRLGKNVGKYLGEAIDIRAVMRDVETAAQQHGWKSEAFLQTPELRLLALTRPAASAPAHRIYLSTGIHGDEPAGPLAALRLLQENPWPQNAELWLCPCLNPTGFPLNRRENAAGTDLNRQYLKPQASETRAHVAWLERQPNFDVCLCLHEDWESNGFYLYELNPENRPSYAEAIVKTVAAVCPVDQSSTIEGRDASGGIIRPSVDPRSRPDWPEAFYLLSNKTRLSYTLEAPSDFPLATRVDALVAGVRAVLEIFKPSS
jgi:predicted deacylase